MGNHPQFRIDVFMAVFDGAPYLEPDLLSVLEPAGVEHAFVIVDLRSTNVWFDNQANYPRFNGLIRLIRYHSQRLMRALLHRWRQWLSDAALWWCSVTDRIGPALDLRLFGLLARGMGWNRIVQLSEAAHGALRRPPDPQTLKQSWMRPGDEQP